MDLIAQSSETNLATSSAASSAQLPIACTIVARNYLPAARVLARSYLAHHPGHEFMVAVIDATEDEAETQDGFQIVGPDKFGIDTETYLRMATAYSLTELATAVKPSLLRELRKTHSVAIFLDPDIQVFAPMPELVPLATEHGIVLTPHCTVPLPQDGLEPADERVHSRGIFNLGFIAVGEGSGPFLDFWAGRLRHDAIDAPEQHLFTDQRWVDQVPALFKHYVLTDPGFNVAYWNVHDRPISKNADGALLTADHRLRFFHFSGYRPELGWLLTYHCARKPRVLLSEHPVLRELCDAYGAALKKAGYAETLEEVPYGFDTFGDGTPLMSACRRLFRDGWIEAELKGKPIPPHAFTADGGVALRAWLSSPDDHAQAAAGLNRLALAAWEKRPDLRISFPQPTGADAEGLRTWCVNSGEKEGFIPRWALPVERPPLRAPNDEFGVNMLGYLTAELGVGEMARLVHDSIVHAEIPIASVVEERVLTNRTGFQRPTTIGNPRFPVTVLAVNADQIPAVLPNHPEVAHQRYVIGLWAWELEDFPNPTWPHSGFDYVDEVWTVSEFSRRAIARHATVPVKAIPVPIRDPGAVSAAGSAVSAGLAQRSRPEDPATFLFIFDFNSTAQRKNPRGLVAAFQKAFPERENVRLVIKAVNARLHPHEAEGLRLAASGDPRIELIERYLSVPELDDLYRNCTCYVSLHRSEGFGLTIAEAMARGIPVICTDYSSTTEFFNSSVGWPVPYRMTAVRKDTLPYHEGALWADPDLSAAAAAMREVVDDPAEAARRGRAAREYILRTHTVEKTAEWMRTELASAYQTWLTRQTAQGAPPESPIQPMRNAREALRWRATAGSPSKLPLAPALRKAVLRALDHYDVHQRSMLAALYDGSEETANRLLAKLDALEVTLDESRRAAADAEQQRYRHQNQVNNQLTLLQSAVTELQRKAPELRSELDQVVERIDANSTQLANQAADVSADLASMQRLIQSRDVRLDQDERALQQLIRDMDAVHAAARLAHAPVPPDAEVVLCDAGALLLPVDEVLLPGLRYNRTFETAEAALMTRLMKANPGAFVDVGAHVGYHTLNLMRTCPEISQVIAVEANPTHVEFLRRNLQVNAPLWQADRVTVLSAAAWDEDGQVRLVAKDPNNSGDHRVHTAASAHGQRVRAVRLESVAEVADAKISLIKLDLQGRDHRALAGLTTILERDEPHVICEFSPEAIEELGDDPHRVLRGYRQLGYQLVVVGENDGNVGGKLDGNLAEGLTDDVLVADAKRDHRELLTLWLRPTQG